MTAAALDLDERPRFEERYRAACAAFAEGRCLDAVRTIRAAVRLPLEPGELRRLAVAVPPLGPEVLPWRRYLRIAVVSSTTIRDHIALLRLQLVADLVGGEMFEGPFDQIAQQIENPDSDLHRFAPELVVIAPSARDVEPSAGLDAEVRRWTGLCRKVGDRHGAAVILHGFVVPPETGFGNLDLALDRAPGRFLRRLNLALAAASGPSFAVLDVDAIASAFGKERWTDPRYWFLAKEEVSTAARPVLVRAQAALIRGMLGLSKKAIVVDLDNTLWGGVVGEDGVARLELGGSPLGEAFVAFQRYLAGLRARGILLAVASKNNAADAMRALTDHPEMVLRPEDFAALRIDWNSKAANVVALAGELGVGLDAVVFVDDNPVERAEVRAACPEVEVVRLPDDPSYFIRALERERWFEAATLTDEDFARGSDMAVARARREHEANAGSLEDFLRELDMTAELGAFDEPNLPRIVQLIHRTNQYNLTTRRYTEPEVRRLATTPGVHTRWLRLRDRFGDRGLVTLVIAREAGDALEIDTWLMSCRVMNRTVEHRVLAEVAAIATGRGLARIAGHFVPTAKNVPARDHYPRLGFDLVREGEGGETWWERPAARELSTSFVRVVRAG